MQADNPVTAEEKLLVHFTKFGIYMIMTSINVLVLDKVNEQQPCTRRES